MIAGIVGFAAGLLLSAVIAFCLFCRIRKPEPVKEQKVPKGLQFETDSAVFELEIRVKRKPSRPEVPVRSDEPVYSVVSESEPVYSVASEPDPAFSIASEPVASEQESELKIPEKPVCRTDKEMQTDPTPDPIIGKIVYVNKNNDVKMKENET